VPVRGDDEVEASEAGTKAVAATADAVTIYTSETCQASRTLARYLTEAEVHFVEKVVETDPGLVRDMFAHGLPVAVVERNGSKKMIIGYQPDRILDALGRPAK
jgi:hypothetical protein